MGIKDQIQEEKEKTTEKDPNNKQDFISFKISVINKLTKLDEKIRNLGILLVTMIKIKWKFWNCHW